MDSESAAQSRLVEAVCIRCGACCRWEGEVRISDSEITRMASYLRITEDEFISSYTQLRHDRRGLGLLMHPDGACVFLVNNECRIHSVKPQQCVDYPLKWRNRDSADRCAAVRALLGMDSN